MTVSLDVVVSAVIVGLCMAVTNTLGTYLTNRMIIRNWERLEKALREKANGEKGEG